MGRQAGVTLHTINVVGPTGQEPCYSVADLVIQFTAALEAAEDCDLEPLRIFARQFQAWADALLQAHGKGKS